MWTVRQDMSSFSAGAVMSSYHKSAHPLISLAFSSTRPQSRPRAMIWLLLIVAYQKPNCFGAEAVSRSALCLLKSFAQKYIAERFGCAKPRNELWKSEYTIDTRWKFNEHRIALCIWEIKYPASGRGSCDESPPARFVSILLPIRSSLAYIVDILSFISHHVSFDIILSSKLREMAIHQRVYLFAARSSLRDALCPSKNCFGV